MWKRVCPGLAGVLMLVSLWGAKSAHAQLAVIDAANLTQTTYTSIQSTITAVQSILSVANEVLELTPLEEIVVSAEFAADMEALATIIQEASGLAYDIQSLNAQITLLFALDSAPDSAAGLRLRMADIRAVVVESYTYALRVQTLMFTALSTIRHATRLVAAIGDLLGNKQGQQTSAQMEATMAKALVTLQAQTAAYERAQSVERIAEPVLIESVNRINNAVMADHPR